MWIILIYFFLSSSGALGDDYCDYLHGLKDEPVEEPSHTFKFSPYVKTYNISRNGTAILPCAGFRNLVGKVWKKGENTICDADNLVGGNFTDSNIETPKYIVGDGSTCEMHHQGWIRDLFITNVQHEDAGEYFCEIKSSPSQVLTKITIKVLDTEFLTTNQTFSVQEGDTVTLPCEVKDLGDDDVPLWTFTRELLTDNKTLLYGFDLDLSEPGLKLEAGYNLQIQNITQNRAGYYSCLLQTTPPKLLTHKVIVKENPIFKNIRICNALCKNN